jgi:hypothetical protein
MIFGALETKPQERNFYLRPFLSLSAAGVWITAESLDTKMYVGEHY